jgi:hypothetical protein
MTEAKSSKNAWSGSWQRSDVYVGPGRSGGGASLSTLDGGGGGSGSVLIREIAYPPPSRLRPWILPAAGFLAGTLFGGFIAASIGFLMLAKRKEPGNARP